VYDKCTIGVISDTHGLLRDEALIALHEVDLIIHAGDVGGADILPALEAIAPVVAVRGNVDRGPWSESLPMTETVETAAGLIHILHIRNDLSIVPGAADVRVVIYGHSHQPENRERDGVLWLNPGSAGPRRFDLPVTLALLRIDGTSVRVERVDLHV